MNIKSPLFIAISVCTLLFFSGCGSNSQPQEGKQSVTSFPRKQTMYVGGFQWGPPTSFNPVHATPAWPMTGNMNLVYECMFGYNIQSGKLAGESALAALTGREHF